MLTPKKIDLDEIQRRNPCVRWLFLKNVGVDGRTIKRYRGDIMEMMRWFYGEHDYVWNKDGTLYSSDDGKHVYIYDKHGRAIREHQKSMRFGSLERVVDYSYDDDGNLIRMYCMGSTDVSYVYKDGRLIQETDHIAGKSWRYGYDDFGRLSVIKRESDRLQRVSYIWDEDTLTISLNKVRMLEIEFEKCEKKNKNES